MKKLLVLWDRLPHKVYVLSVLLVAVTLLVVLFPTGGGNETAYAGEWGATDQEAWETQNAGTDWVSPDIVFVGHHTTELTQPLMPDDTVVQVKSTDKFRESGWVKLRSESINYASKTKTTFEGCKRSGDIQTPVRVGTIVAMLERGYYQKGDIEKYNIRLHCGDGETECTDMLTVETWPDETKAWMPIKKKLAYLESVVLISSINERLRATRYDPETSEVYVEGFQPDTNRILTIRYQGYNESTWYDIIPTITAHPFEDYGMPPEGFENWFTLSEPSPILLKAGETREVEVRLQIPEDAVVASSRWICWIWTGESNPEGMSATGMAVTWLVNMGR